MRSEKQINFENNQQTPSNSSTNKDEMTFCKKRKMSLTKSKNKKDEDEPIPMKLRALPRSFWQQPNQPIKQTYICPDLPPLIREEGSSIHGNNNTGIQPLSSPNEERTTPANTELLFSLFRVVDSRNNKSLIRRGRPKKSSLQTCLRDSDPCLVSTLNESPLVVTNKGRENGQNNSYSNLLAELVVRL